MFKTKVFPLNALFLLCFIAMSVNVDGELCNISESYKSILLKCIPAVLTAVLDDPANCNSTDAYWECVQHIAEKCELPVRGKILDEGKTLLKDLICSGTRIHHSVLLQTFAIAFCLVVKKQLG
ncbi:uncharacterized protein LOC125683060 [Ostrea edulis]|uniref:uncharacterized protein LOC125683060 n=1 Tax=Ostrea edulis TaxID=37623 RepID=UPI0020942317|nr:uncharacterized protein LOC125683060 [Ostrea edulis]